MGRSAKGTPFAALAQGAPPRRVAVFRALQLGDLLCALPALRALRRAWPQARITLIGLAWAAGFASRFAHLVDDFIAFPGFPGLPEVEPDVTALPEFLLTAQSRCFDLAVQLHGRGDMTNPVVALLGARATAGFRGPATYCPDPARHAPWPEAGHEIERLLTLVDYLHLARAGTQLEFPLAPGEVAQADALRHAARLVRGGYACVHPGARLHSRRWPPEYFAAVAKMLAQTGLRVVVTGTADEADLTARVARQVPDALDLAGCTSLGVLAALIRDARLLLCNDTGVSHVAAALRTPSVVVSCGADPARFAPLDHTLHEVLHEQVICRPCAYDRCPVGHPCAYQLAPARVAERVRARLAATAPAAAPLRHAG
jgi:ADP-heptose:LPS heptosyltransferase